MTKIAEVVNLKTGYANFVELKSAFEAAQENADRMAMYRPTKAHRAAFERICRGLYQPNDKKFYLLSGSYGTGKSHLCLMTANFLSRSSGDPEIAGFYENYARLDPQQAKLLKNIRKGGQYLVAICDYHAGRNFEDVLMKAVFEACEAKGLDAGVQTQFGEAERRLEDWEQQGDTGGFRNFYEDFRRALEAVAPGVTVAQLREGLRNYNSEMFETFREAFRATMGGVEFQTQAGNLIPVLRELVHSDAFKARFKGLAIFFDEFGFTLENAAYSKDVLQGFMETICKNEPNVLFVGCIHKDFKAYADRLSAADAAVMTARITQVDLLNEGIEEIIGAIVETDKTSETWRRHVAPRTGIFDQLLPTSASLGLFPWIEDVARIRQRVLEDIYGVHPMALACLLRLSSEIGSDARSTFTFFSGDVGGAEGSYADFIKAADLTTQMGKLTLYTVDQLFEFFRSELSPRNADLREGQRRAVNGYYASLDALRKTLDGRLPGLEDDQRTRVLRTLLIYQLCRIPTSLSNVQFGLYALSNAEQNQVERYLQDLVKSGAVFYRQQSQTYELAVSTGEDPYDLIQRYLDSPDRHPEDTLAAFLEEAGDSQRLKHIEAKSHNLPFGEDKRFRVRYVRAKDIGPALWDEIHKEQVSNLSRPSRGFEGTLVYAMCEDDGEIAMARAAANTIEDGTVALAVPHAPQPFTEALLRVNACRHYLPPDAAEKISAQTESRLRDIFEDPVDGYLPQLQQSFRDISDGSGACWYRQGGKVLVDKPKQYHRPADILADALFEKRCRIPHPDLNLCHDEKWRTGRNTALKQAVRVLFEAERVLIDNGHPDNHGEKRYLEKVLLRGAGALRKSGSDGAVTYFTCEIDPAKLSDDFPVLKALCTRLDTLDPGESLPIGAFLHDAAGDPYGAGGTQLVLSLAHVARGYGERLLVYTDSTQMMVQPLRAYEDLVKIVSDPAAKAVFVVRRITDAQELWVDLIAKAVAAPALKHGERRTVNGTFEALQTWWDGLSPVAKVANLYDDGRRRRLARLKDLMATSRGNVDRFGFLLKRLPAVYTGDLIGDSLTEADARAAADAFAEDVALLNSGKHRAETQLAQAICTVYGTRGDMVACERVVTDWYEGLDPSQRDPYRHDDKEAQHLLRRLANTEISFGARITKHLAQDYGFGALPEWTSLHMQDYAAKLQQAKTAIDTAKPVVPKPAVDEGVHEVSSSEAVYVEVPEGAVGLIYSTDGKDPRSSESAQKTSDRLNLTCLLKESPNARIQVRAVDQEGNTSDAASVELVNKERKYEVEVAKDFWGVLRATFLWPNDAEGLTAALKSVVSHGLDESLLGEEHARQILAALNALDADE
jgi:hypothetical protein